jgi:hypothetical protein
MTTTATKPVKARTKPTVWTERAIIDLGVAVASLGTASYADAVEYLQEVYSAPGAAHTPERAIAKALQLKLIRKPGRPQLTAEQKADVAAIVREQFDRARDGVTYAEPERTLAIRYAITTLQGLLPKKPKTA